jgi:diguanylate cyclase (GGDEF)-like protein/PAS domain S-box-containing protein
LAVGRRITLSIERALVCLVVGSALVCAWFVADLGPLAAQVQLYWMLQPPMDAALVVFSLYAARLATTAPHARPFWLAFAVAGAVFAVGDLAQLTTAIAHPSAAAASPGMIQLTCVAIGASGLVWAMARYPLGLTTRAEQIRFWLDAGAVMIGAAVFVWFFAFSRGVRENTGLVTLFLGSGVLLVAVFAVVKLVLSGSAPMTGGAALAAGASAFGQWAITALTPVLHEVSDLHVQLALRMIPSALVVAAPLVQALQVAADPDRLVRRRVRPYSKLPYVTIGATDVLLVYVVAHGTPRQVWGVLAGAIVITAVVVVRQLMALRENARLLDVVAMTVGQLRQQEQRFRSLVQHASDLTLVLAADTTVTYVTPAVERVLGIEPADAVGHPALAHVHSDDLPTVQQALALCASEPLRVLSCEARFRHVDGSWRWLQVTSTNLLDDPSVRGIVCNAHDITEAKGLQDRLRHLASHDALTRLPNRLLFEEEVSALHDAPTDSLVSVLLIDIDQFKAINDAFGHHMGDQVLTAAAERLVGSVRAGDLVARLGGDEFAVLMPGASRTAAAGVADRISRCFTEPVIADGRTLHVGVSVGLAHGLSRDAELLLRHADAAMYAKKRSAHGASTPIPRESEPGLATVPDQPGAGSTSAATAN